MTPKQIKPAEGENPIAAFGGGEVVSPEDYTLLDRSTLENWAKCPAMAQWIDSGKVNTSSDIANAGEEVHKAFSAGLQEWIDEQGNMTLRQLRDFVQGALMYSRPDVQPESIAAARRSLYDWADFVTSSVHPDNVLHFDNGQGDRCGQLAYDIDALQCRPTSEVDLLFSTSHPELLFEVDYKSGRKLHTMQSVQDSFQFSMHAALVFEKYPSVTGLHVQIWHTRTNNRSYAAEFNRKDLPRYKARIQQAAAEWFLYRDLPASMCPTWPCVEKCKWCAAAHKCPVSGGEPVEGETAEDVLLRYIAMSEKLGRLKSWLTEYADNHGDIKTKCGDCFGRVAVAKPTAKTYKETE